MTYDQAQSPRIRQRNGMENPGIRMVESTDMPEVAYKGQLIYLKDLDLLSVYAPSPDPPHTLAWQNIADDSFAFTYVQAFPPPSPQEGDFWQETDTGILWIWDGTQWVDALGVDQVENENMAPDSITATEIVAETITATEIAADAITVDKLKADAISAKHTITGAVFRTAASGNRIVMRDDGTGGVIQGDTGSGESSFSQVNPGLMGGVPSLQLRSGSMTGTPGATLILHGYGSGGTPVRTAQFNCDTGVSGDITGNRIFVSFPDTTTTGTPDCIFGSSGQIRQKTSSRRYKDDIEDLSIDVHKALKLHPRQWRDKALGGKGIGFIAEEAEELGLEDYVGRRSEDNKVNTFEYFGWIAVLQAICQRQQRDIQELNHRVATLERMTGRQS